MNKYLISLLLILSSAMLGGCGEGKVPDWFKFGRPKPQVKRRPQAQVPAQRVQPKVEGTVLASINGRIITLEDFNLRIEAHNMEIEAAKNISDEIKEANLIKTAEQKREFLKQLEDESLLVSDAIERGLNRDRDIVRTMRILEEQLLLAKIIETEKDKTIISTQEVNDFYESNTAFFSDPEERKASVIVLPTEEKAKELMINLWQQGGNFEALARAHSTDKSKSAAKGGDIGFIVQQMPFPQPGKKIMFDKFTEVAFSLELHKNSMPFKGPDGFYIIKVTDLKPSRQKPISEVYNDIEQALMIKEQAEALDTLLGNLRKVAKIVVHDELLTN
jgi:parvulin-like peptidyl-prolyl isomerase